VPGVKRLGRDGTTRPRRLMYHSVYQEVFKNGVSESNETKLPLDNCIITNTLQLIATRRKPRHGTETDRCTQM
jgi:hypothetical protein